MAGKFVPLLVVLSVGLAATLSISARAVIALLFTQTIPAISVSGGAVGGTPLPIDKLALLLPYITVAVALATALTTLFIIRRNRVGIVRS